MTQISAILVKELREKTGAGMMDCKKALVESEGDFEKAIESLRTKGLAAAAKKSGRSASEGLVAALCKDNKGVVVEVNSETDFVAKNTQFQDLVSDIINIAYINKDISLEALKASKNNKTGKTIDEDIVNAIAVIGENINLRRIDQIEVSKGIVAGYIHNEIKPGFGKIAVIIGLESEGDKEKLFNLAKQLSMHIAAARPEALSVSEIDNNNVEKEKKIFAEQARNSGKPDNIIEKMVEGRVKKYYEEVVLLEQLFVIDGKTKISDVVANFAKEINASIKITKFIRYELGEGIEVERGDFAAEVMSTAGIKKD